MDTQEVGPFISKTSGASSTEIELTTDQLNYIRCNVEHEKFDITISNSRVMLELMCPGHFRDTCNTDKLLWTCQTCKINVEYNFDSYIYCSCGRSNISNFSFKCANVDHMMFIPFDNNTLRQELSQLKPYEEINILVLGPTGVGKTTWINAIVNYLSYKTMDEAMSKGALHVIPARFTVTNDDFDIQVVEIGGSDTNEDQKAGHSSTQDPKTYSIKFNNIIFRIIDTPGIGDVRGIKQDKINTNKIVKHISNLKNLHAICILLKPNETRIHVLFRFCIKELLVNLHRSATTNILFCFTNARSTLYRPGDTLVVLRDLLKDIDAPIPLSKSTVYCLDNEAFRLLCTLKYPSITYTDSQKNSFKQSWDTSVEEIKRMIARIQTLRPHIIHETTSLCEVRRMILNLTQPLADISRNIQTNIVLINEKEKLIKETQHSEDDLAKLMYIKQIKLETEKLDRPRTVCTDAACVETYKYENVTQILYVKHCHATCYLTGVTPEQHPNPDLKHCAAMRGTNNCVHCGHRWEKHMHITYNQVQKTVDVLDQNVVTEINTKKTNREKIALFVNELKKKMDEQKKEQEQITKVGVQLGSFLRRNAITPYNDAIKDYLNVLIDLEKQKPNKTEADRKTYDALLILLDEYNKEKAILDAAMASPNEKQLTVTDVKMLINSLFNLKINGADIKKAYDVITQANTEIQTYKEKYVPLNRRRRPKQMNRKNDSYCSTS